MKLISMCEFVDSQKETPTFDTPQIDWYDKEVDKLYKIRKYSKFIQQPLKLCMFVPVDKNDNILTEPVNYSAFEVGMSGKEFNFNFIDCQEYKESLENILFEGFVFYKDDNESFSLDLINSDGSETFCFMKNEIIEDLLTFDYYFTLTETAIKNI